MATAMGPAFGSGRGKSRTCHHDILRQTEVWTPDEKFLTGSQEFKKNIENITKKALAWQTTNHTLMLK